MTRTPPLSKSEKAVHSLPVFLASPWAAFFVPTTVHIGGYACFVSQSLLVMVIALSMPFGYTCVAISGKENDTDFASSGNLADICERGHAAFNNIIDGNMGGFDLEKE